jgi:hypothetical protein
LEMRVYVYLWLRVAVERRSGMNGGGVGIHVEGGVAGIRRVAGRSWTGACRQRRSSGVLFLHRVVSKDKSAWSDVAREQEQLAACRAWMLVQ